MKVSDFTFDLPEELIAQDPLEDRSSSRLLTLDKNTGEIGHDIFHNIVNYLKPGDCLVLNNTKVIPARLIGAKEETGGKVEVLLLKRKQDNVWETLVKPGKKARPGARISFGDGKLVGEVISLDKDRTTIQVYEETSGLKPGEIVEASGEAVSVTLAPGILDNIFDGIVRPLERIAENAGAFITRGISVDSLDMEKLWDTKLDVNEGDVLHGGDIYAQVQETRAIVHKCMVPPDLTGTVTFVASDGEHAIKDHMITLRLDDGTEKQLTMIQRWPIRVPRPVHDRIPA